MKRELRTLLLPTSETKHEQVRAEKGTQKTEAKGPTAGQGLPHYRGPLQALENSPEVLLISTSPRCVEEEVLSRQALDVPTAEPSPRRGSHPVPGTTQRASATTSGPKQHVCKPGWGSTLELCSSLQGAGKWLRPLALSAFGSERVL